MRSTRVAAILVGITCSDVQMLAEARVLLPSPIQVKSRLSSSIDHHLSYSDHYHLHFNEDKVVNSPLACLQTEHSTISFPVHGRKSPKCARSLRI